MTTLILLTADQADQVRGPSASTPAAALEPIALTSAYQGATHVLGVEVIGDPAHAEFHDLLSTCPQVDLTAVADLLQGGASP